MRLPDLPGYRYEGLLGEDPFGWTFVASHEGGERRAVRVFKAQATSDRLLYPYFKALSDPQGGFEGIDRICDYVLQDAKRPTVCATPFHGWRSRDGGSWQVGSLRRLMSMLSREQAVEVVRDLAGALGGLHAADLFHAGLRPSEIHLVPGAKGGQKVCVAGFGQVFMGGLQYLEAGEFLFYAAPEQLATGDFNGGRGKAWDVYAFGVVAFQLLTGHLPRLDQFRRRHEENPGWLGATAAIVFGEVAEVTESFLEQLEAERSVEWPTAAPNAREEALRKVIGSCLGFTAVERPATIVEVAEAVRQACLVPAAAVRPAKAEAKAEKEEEAKEQDKAPEPFEAAVAEAGILDGTPGFEREPARSLLPQGFFAEIRENATLRWQLAAICSLMVTLVLTFFAFVNYLDARKAKNIVESELQESERERRASIDRQAEAYRRMREEQVKKNQLVSDLNEAEDSKNNLLGQVKLARQLLRETQDNGDRFFQLVLENRDSDVPEFRAGRAAALEEGRRHYERLVETYGDASDFIVSTANAFFYLGRIYREMGEFGESLGAFGEAERRYSALLEDESTAKVEFIKNIALSKSGLGELAIRNSQHSVARHYFTESSRFWAEARSRDPSLASVAALQIHGNSLAIVECEFAMDRLDAALDAAMSVGVSLTAMQKEDPGNHRVVGALAKSFSHVGRVLEMRRDLETARQAYQQSSDLYAEAVRLDAAVDEYQLGLGNSLARVGLLANDMDKLEGAAEVLGRVVASNPYESIYLKTLADIYGALAAGQRDGGKVQSAVALEAKAIGILKPIVEGNRAVAPDVKFSYSQRLAHLAELLGDSGKFDDSRVPLKEAIDLLEGIAEGEGASAEYRRALARTRGMAGFACMKSGKKGEAKEHLELAKTEWQSYMAAHPDDSDAAQAVKWTSEQLRNLR